MRLRFFPISLSLICLYICANNTSVAQTSGPVQPEVQSFKPVGAEDMVNTFTGDFSYNIPLFLLPGPDGGYPFNLFYTSGITMTQEASWVGLGWNLNPGAINRQMNNLPDEFNGEDKVSHYKTMKDTWTAGGTFSIPNLELIGVDVSKLKVISGGDINFTLSYNSMTGVGMALGGSLSFGRSDNSKLIGGIGFNSGNLSGLGVNPSVGIRKVEDDGVQYIKSNSYSIGLNLNSITGIQGVNLSGTRSVTKYIRTWEITGVKKDENGMYTITSLKEKKVYDKTKTGSFGSYIPLSMPYSAPSIKDELIGGSISAAMKLGAESPTPAHVNYAFSGFYSQQKLKHKGQWKTIPAYGYNNVHKSISGDGVTDFTREQEQSVSASIPLLPVPIATNDIYSINCQGFNAVFRPVRSDIGYFTDQFKNTMLVDGDINIELGFGNGVKVGGDLSVAVSATQNSNWLPPGKSLPSFRDKEDHTSGNSYFEPVYYRILGEASVLDKSTYEGIFRGNKPSFLRLKNNGFDLDSDEDYSLTETMEDISGGKFTFNTLTTAINTRTPRTQVVQHFTNAEIKPGGNDGILQQFDFEYYSITSVNDGSGPEKETINISNAGTLQSSHQLRAGLPGHHPGGYEVIKSDGTRYIFALPVYVKEQMDVSFSNFGCSRTPGSADCPYTFPIPVVPGGDKNDPTKIRHDDSYETLEITKLPQYPVSFLLTSVLGPDYVDVTGDGLTDDDLGYWVKFTYVKTTNDYKWKAPFNGANFIVGQEALTEDNMGTFSCGLREVWYLLSTQTKSHIAEFSLSKREDAKGAKYYLQNSGDGLGKSSYKLDKIELYSKLEKLEENPVPIQKIAFSYAKYADGISSTDNESLSELCLGVDNAGSGRGKLTLTGLHMTFRDNSRGERNGYKFQYGIDGTWANNSADNPNYKANANDRWGNYQPDGAVRNKNYYVPYTRQDNDASYASVWDLKRVVLPSGSLLKINYEPDDYAYVQNRTTANMLVVRGFGKDGGDYYVEVDLPDLPEEMQGSSCDKSCKENYIKAILKNETQLFVRLYANLQKWTEPVEMETISAFCNYELEGGSGNKRISIEGGGQRLRIYVKEAFGALIERHPFQSAIYNYIQGNRMDLFTSPATRPNSMEGTSGLDKLNAIASLVTNIVKFYELFMGVHAKCAADGLGDLDNPFNGIIGNSYVRLPSLNGFKKGGGSRVKSIVISEQADGSGDQIGSVYDYTMEETYHSKSGVPYLVKISSGVASNEPVVGGDETAFKEYIEWPNSVGVFSSVSQFSETPYNVSFYPSPSVGYRKVTVSSLATDKVIKGDLPARIRTTGATVYEYYTAKDFPVLIDRTILKERSESLRKLNMIPVGMTGIKFKKSYVFASQGYTVELNDMHGKQKKVSSFGQGEDGKLQDHPFSWQEYHYLKSASPDRRAHNLPVDNILSNEVITMCSEGNKSNSKLLGIEVEQYLDIRKTESNSSRGGATVNSDNIIIPLFIPMPSGFPIIDLERNMAGLCVNNKIIQRYGILDKVVGYERGTYTVIKNEVFDEITGNPVLMSTVKAGKMEDIINPLATVEKSYQYDIMGHWIYEGMDGAYKNVQHEIIPFGGYPKSSVETKSGKQMVEFTFGTEQIAKGVTQYYYQGDEVIWCTYSNGGPDLSQMAKGVVMSTQDNKLLVEFVSGSTDISPENIYIKVIRPGRRNLLGVPVSSIESRNDPTSSSNRTLNQCQP